MKWAQIDYLLLSHITFDLRVSLNLSQCKGLDYSQISSEMELPDMLSLPSGQHREPLDGHSQS